MTAEFWWVLLSVLLYGALHSWLASLGLKAWLRRLLGAQGGRWFRLVYNLLASLLLLPVAALLFLLPDRDLYQIPWPWLVLALIGQGAALLALVSGVLHTGLWHFLGFSQLLAGEQAAPPRLVVNGLYRWVRHPLYTAGLVFVWLMPSMSWNLLALGIGVTIYILIGAVLEERKLRLEFGAAYEEYARRTPMLIPGLRLPRR